MKEEQVTRWRCVYCGDVFDNKDAAMAHDAKCKEELAKFDEHAHMIKCSERVLVPFFAIAPDCQYKSWTPSPHKGGIPFERCNLQGKRCSPDICHIWKSIKALSKEVKK